MWRKTDKWRPARTGTASGGGGVQNSETGVIGFAKSTFAHREKLASDLAARVGVAVPEVTLDRIEGSGALHAISFAHGKESIDVSLLRDRLSGRFNSPEVQGALRRATGLLPFHVWIATRDLKDEHLVVATDPDGSYYVAAIDFEYSFNWEGPDGGAVEMPPAPQSLTENVDKDLVERVVTRIEAVTDDEIGQFVHSLPNELADNQEKERLTRGLIVRRAKIREVMKKQGWLP